MKRLHIVAATALLLVTMPLAAAAPKKAKVEADAKAGSPEAAAKRLYAAWKAHDRKAALGVASREAVSKLFSARFHTLKFQGCERADEGGFQCVYHDAAEELYDLAFNVDGGASAGYGVNSVSFSSEE